MAKSRFRPDSGKQRKSRFRQTQSPVASDQQQLEQPKRKGAKSEDIRPVVIGSNYCIDQLEIVSKIDPVQLRAEIKKRLRPISQELVLYSAILDLKKVKEKKNKDTKRKKYDEANKQGFKSVFRMTCPTAEFFNILFANESIFGVYKPWVIELCKELELSSNREAIFLADQYINTAYKRNSTHTFIFDARKTKNQEDRDEPKFETEYEYEDWLSEQERRRRDVEDVIGYRTLYLGESDFCFVVYARKSKVTGKPCVHMEWRLLWSDTYKRFNYLGISKKKRSYFSSLKNLTKFNLADHWESLTAKMIKRSKINEIAVAKQFMDRTDPMNGFKAMKNEWRRKNRLSEKEKMRLGLEYFSSAKLQEIESTSHFVRYWQKFRKMVKHDERGTAIPHYSTFLDDIPFMYEGKRSLLRREININKREPKKPEKKIS